MYTFGYNFRPWVDGKVFADGPAIRNYVRATADESGITERIQFGTKVTQISWDTQTARWTITARHGDQTETWTARFIMMCSGYYRYEAGYMPDFPRHGDFKGDIIHPQLWSEDYDYTGKKVVIIGSGATAITLVPAMADKAEHVTMLQRSPSYVAARPSRDGFADFLQKTLPSRLAYMITWCAPAMSCRACSSSIWPAGSRTW
jgi:monooxygenase